MVYFVIIMFAVFVLPALVRTESVGIYYFSTLFFIAIVISILLDYLAKILHNAWKKYKENVDTASLLTFLLRIFEFL